MSATTTQLDTFTRAYITCALWSSMDNANEQGGEPLDANYSAEDIAPDTLAKMVADCEKFQAKNSHPIAWWVDFVDHCRRNNEISKSLASRATL